MNQHWTFWIIFGISDFGLRMIRYFGAKPVWYQTVSCGEPERGRDGLKMLLLNVEEKTFLLIFLLFFSSNFQTREGGQTAATRC